MIVCNGEKISKNAGDLLEILGELQLSPRRVTVEYNGKVLQYGEYQNIKVVESDQVVIMSYICTGC